MRRLFPGVVVAGILLVACPSEEPPGPGADDRSPAPIRTITDPPGPYVSVAVDNHFHDIHPVDHKEIEADTVFIVRNEGRNLHNVSIPGTEISRDIEPGESFALRPIGKLGGPGTYEVVCKYHADQGMTGEITVIP